MPIPQAIPTAQEVINLHLPAPDFGRVRELTTAVIDAYERLVDEVLANSLEKKAVISISAGLTTLAQELPQPGGSVYALYGLMEELVSYGTVICISSGNNGGNVPLSRLSYLGLRGFQTSL